MEDVKYIIPRTPWTAERPSRSDYLADSSGICLVLFFFFKQKTAYEIGLGIPAEPLFRSNYFKAPWMPDRTEANPNELNQDDARYGFRCCHLKNIWTAPLPPDTELSRQMTTSTTSIDIMGLQAAYANLHTDQERDYFMQRYHDVISSFGGKTSYDADNRPLLVMRSNLWASGYDVDGTDQTSLGQFSGRVQQTYKHSVPRFFVPEHGTMFTLALVRFPPTATKVKNVLALALVVRSRCEVLKASVKALVFGM